MTTDSRKLAALKHIDLCITSDGVPKPIQDSARALCEVFTRGRGYPPGQHRKSSAEVEDILPLLAEGLRVVEIAERLGCSAATISARLKEVGGAANAKYRLKHKRDTP